MMARWPQVVIPLLGAAAMAGGRLAADRWPPIPAVKVGDWLPWLGLLAGVVGAATAAANRPWATWPLRTALLAIVGWLITRALVPHALDTGSAIGWTAAVTALGLASAGALDALDRGGGDRTGGSASTQPPAGEAAPAPGGPAAGAAAAAAIGFAALVSIFSYMALDLVMFLGAMGVLLLASGLGLRWPAIRLGPGGHTFAVSMLAALLSYVAFFSVQPPHKALAGAALLLPVVGLVGAHRWFGGAAWRRWLAAALAVTIVGAAVVAPLASDYFRETARDQSEQDGSGYDYGL